MANKTEKKSAQLNEMKNPFVLSAALILENFRLYWYVPALTFILYFFGGIFPILTNYSNLSRIDVMISNNFHNLSVVFIPLLIFVPLIAACISMSFFHSENRALALHSQPYSKSRLFNSQVLSGWLMCIIPLVLMTVLYLCLMKEVPYNDATTVTYSSSGVYNSQTINLYTASAVLRWFAISSILMTFHYGMFVFAGSLVGTTVMQVLLSGVFFGIVPLILWITYAYCDSFLIGYVGMTDTMEEIITRSNPIFRIVVGWGDDEDFSIAVNMKYLIAGLIMLVLSRVAYAKAKLEKVGDSMIFRITEEIITYLIVFVGMAAFGYLFYSMGEYGDMSRKLMLCGFVVGTLITFTTVKIILAKSVKILNRTNLCSLCIFAVIGVLFVSCTVYDLTGYTKRVPDIDKVESVTLDSSTFASVDRRYYYIEKSIKKGGSDSVSATEPEVIEAMLKLHKYAVENELYDNTNGVYLVEYASNGADAYGENIVPYDTVKFEYKLKNGRIFERRFSIKSDEKVEEMINSVVTSDSMMSYFTLADKLDLSRFNSGSIQLNLLADKYSDEYYEKFGDEITYSDDSLIVKTLTKTQIEGLVEAQDADIRTRDYYYWREFQENGEVAFADTDIVIYLEPLSGSTTQKLEDTTNANIARGIAESTLAEESSAELDTATISLTIYSTDKNTLAYLRDIGVI